MGYNNKSRKDKSEESKSRIVETALRLIGEKGFDKVSVSEITKEAGVSKGAFYIHFASKEDLIEQQIAVCYDEFKLDESYAPNGLNQFDAEHAWRGYYSTGAENPGIRVWHVDARLAYEMGDDFALTNDPLKPGSFVAFTNSWGDNQGTKLAREYDDNCLLFQIRNDKELTNRPKSTDQNVTMKDATLFHDGDTFTMEDYSKHFAKDVKLNSGEDPGWEFSMEAIQESDGGYTATLNFVCEG